MHLMLATTRSVWSKSSLSFYRCFVSRAARSRLSLFHSNSRGGNNYIGSRTITGSSDTHHSFKLEEGIQLEDSEDVNFGSYTVILPPEPFVFGVEHIKPREVPGWVVRPSYARTLGLLSLDAYVMPNGNLDGKDGRIVLGSEDERKLRKAAGLARDVRVFSGGLVKPGITTDSIDAAIHEYIVSRGAYPSPLGYKGFPKSCCTSVNNVITHGIPDDRPLENGDIVNIDITVYLDGYHGDTSQTWLVGDVDTQGRALCALTTAALEEGIKACAPGRRFADIGKGIQRIVNRCSDEAGMEFCISQQFTGHGIGQVFHREPWVLHYLNDEPGVMLPGHCFTIEPAIIQGRNPSGWLFPDGWTASTENCARSAQAEHMVLITETGAEVLTR